MKRIFCVTMLALGIFVSGAAWGLDALTGVFGNRAGTVTITKKAKNSDTYEIVISDKSGKCKIALTGKTGLNSGNGMTSKIITATETDAFPNFSLWPAGQSMKLGEDALPFDKLAPACGAFRNNGIFNRQK